MIDDNYKFAIQAMQLLREKKNSEAISICESGLVGYPSYPCAIAILSVAYYFHNEPDTAKILIDAAYGRYPVNAAVVNTKNKIYSNSLDLDDYNRVIGISGVENILDEHTTQEEIMLSELDIFGDIPNDTTTNNINNNIIINSSDVYGEDSDERDEGLDNILYDFSKQLETVKNLTDKLKNLDLDADIDIKTIGRQPDEIYEEAAGYTTYSTVEILKEIEDIEENNYEYESDLVEVEFENNNMSNNINNKLEDENIENDAEFSMENNMIVEDKTNSGETELEVVDSDVILERFDEETYFPEHFMQDSIVSDIADNDSIDKIENLEKENSIENNIEPEEIKFEFPYEYAVMAGASITPIAMLYQRDLDFSRMELDSDIFTPVVIENFHLDLPLDIPDVKPFENAFSYQDEIASASDKKQEKLNINININKDNNVDDKVLEFLELSKKLEKAKITPVAELEDNKDIDDTPIVASETMAKLFVKQKLYKKAIEVYNLLLEEKPEKYEYYQEQISDLLEK